jgi:manganese transport protein
MLTCSTRAGGAHFRTRAFLIKHCGLIVIIFGCFVYEIIVSQPTLCPCWPGAAEGGGDQPRMLAIAIGILGTTVMLHNLCHAGVVQIRQIEHGRSRRMAIKFSTIDSTVALSGVFVNAAILVTAAATHSTGRPGTVYVQRRPQAAHARARGRGGQHFSLLALLASGQKFMTGTLVGQIVMETSSTSGCGWPAPPAHAQHCRGAGFGGHPLYGDGADQLLKVIQTILSFSSVCGGCRWCSSPAGQNGRFVIICSKVTAWLVSGIIIP